jgi:pSer/pThr/pTyr-binding forkhead associated (FHA) protein
VARSITFRIWLDGKLVSEPTVEESTIRIGNASTAQVRLEHPSVSRVHCVIEVGSDLQIMDLGSSSGTFVNAAPITRTTLTSGDQLRIGDYVLDVIASEATNLLGAPARVKPAPEAAEPLAAPELQRPSLLDISEASATALPPPPSASVELPRVRPDTVELTEHDLVEVGHDADPGTRRRG